MKQKQLLLLLASCVLAMPTMGDTVRLTTATPVGESVEITVGASSQPKLVWADGSETVVSAAGQPEEVTIKSASFSIECEGSLRALYVPHAAVTDIDLSDAPGLEVLHCPHNQLVKLDLAGVPALTDLDVQDNGLKDLNLTGKANALETLNCAYNELTMMRLGAKPSLTTLICAGNRLKTLSVGNYPALRTVWCQDNELTSLILPRHENFHTLYAFNNALSSLTLVAPALTSLRVDHNGLTNLDLSQATRLEEVDVDHNQLSLITMAASDETAFSRFYAHENELSYNSFPTVDHLTYYALLPQSPYDLGIAPAVGEEFKITTPFVQNAQGDATIFTLNWFDASTGEPLVEDTDFSSRLKGTYTFLKAFPDGVYAEVTTRRYPDLTIRTAKMPVGTPSVGIDAPTLAGSLTVSDGMLSLKLASAARVRIVSPSGAVWLDKELPTGAYSWNLDGGVYLVNGAKVLVP